jgi:hypothetical protein
MAVGYQVIPGPWRKVEVGCGQEEKSKKALGPENRKRPLTKALDYIIKPNKE